MDLNEFKATLEQPVVPEDLEECLKALWYDGRDNWDQAHQLAQDAGGNFGNWIHAYLHRKEGDLGNASFWYSRAGRKMPDKSLEEEWEDIARELLGA